MRAATPAIAHGSRRVGHVVDEGVDHPVGAAGVGQQAADHGAERDEQTDAADGRPDAGLEAVIVSAKASPPTTPSTQRAQDEGQERVHLQPGDQHDDDGDAQDRGEDELEVTGVAGDLLGGGEHGHDEASWALEVETALGVERGEEFGDHRRR